MFRRTLEQVAWNSRLVRGDAGEELARLRAKTDGELGIGGAGLAGTAMRPGLVDEVALLVQPVILGSGTRFFPPLDARIGLRLLGTRTFASGVMLLRYEMTGGGL